jgi:hypothetical protein
MRMNEIMPAHVREWVTHLQAQRVTPASIQKVHTERDLHYCDGRRADLAGAARLELVSGVVQLRPEDAVLEAMLHGWHAQQTARGLREDTIFPRC